MALTVKDRVKESTTVTGTSAIVLGGSPVGFQTFSTIGNGNSTYYSIYSGSLNEWEVGVGTYAAASNSLSRDTVLSSSNNGLRVNFSVGIKEVSCTLPASVFAGVQTKQSWYISVKDFGAVGNGSTDDTAAFQAALNYANSIGGGIVFMPPGRYRKADTANSSLIMYSNTTLCGDGDASVLFFDDNPSVARFGNDMLVANNTSNIAFENFKVEGTALTYLNETNQKQCFTGSNIDGLRMNNVTITGTRFMATAFSYVKNGVFTNNRLSYCVRDGIRATNSNNIVVANNMMSYVSDDAIALHSLNTATIPGAGFVVTGNTLDACQGIKILGAKIAVVKDNIIRRATRGPIDIELSSSVEGTTPVFDIDVSNNQVIDAFGTSGTNYGILVASALGRTKAALAQQPGVSVAPFDYNYLNNLTVNGYVNVGMSGIKINNNSVTRTLGATAAYSNWGYGQRFDRNTVGFFSDPAVTAADFQMHGINVRAPVNGLQISGNVIRGMGTGFAAIILQTNGTSNVQDFSNAVISNNLIYDCPGAGIQLTDAGSGLGASQIYVVNNTFDLDPFFRSASHNADNTWTSAGSSPGITATLTIGIVTANNIFKNCGQTRLGSATEAGPSIVYSDFVGSGDNAGNKGVRSLPSAVNNLIVPIDGDPTSATFGNVQNTVLTYSGSLPTTGRYVYGHRVLNVFNINGSAGSRYSITGWWRGTTGSGHVLNTDWIEMRTLTGT
jgi:hypothetical protein